MKIFKGLSDSKNMIFIVKKLLIVGVGLTLWPKGEKNLCKRNERQIYRIYAADSRFSPANI
jgi:hypothetical protein